MDGDGMAGILIIPFALVIIAIVGAVVVAAFVAWAVLSVVWWIVNALAEFAFGRIDERQAHRRAVSDVDGMFNRFDRQVTAALRQSRR